MILFVKNEKSVEKSAIGFVKYEYVGRIDLKDLKHVEIKDIVDEGRQVQVYPHNDRTYCLLFVSSRESVLTRVIIDSDKNVITPSETITFHNTSYPVLQFKKHKNNIIGYYNCNRSYCITKLNLDISVAKYVDIGYKTSFLSANDDHVYAYCNKKLYIYQNDLKSLNQVGQSNNSTGAFYLPTDIKQFESHKGMYYWLNNTNLQILREEDGQLVKSVSVTTNNFIIDSNDNVVLINHSTKELNYFTADGILVDKIFLDNYTADLRFLKMKDGEPLFYSETSLYLFRNTITDVLCSL